jgi:hypothetical protein
MARRHKGLKIAEKRRLDALLDLRDANLITEPELKELEDLKRLEILRRHGAEEAK